MHIFEPGSAQSRPGLPRITLKERRASRDSAEDLNFDALIRKAAENPDPDIRALGLAATKLSALQAEDLRTIERLRANCIEGRAIVKNLLTALITIDDKGKICAANPAAELMFGYAFEELEGKSVGLLLPYDSQEEGVAKLTSAYFGTKGRVVELEGRRKDGEIFPCELMMFPTETGKGFRFTGNIRDLTDKKAAERIQTDLVSIVSHELRTPLTSIRGSLRLIETGVFGTIPEEAAELVGIAERNCTRLIHLVGDMLDLERLENGQIELSLRPTPLRRVVDRAIDSVRGFAADNQIRLDVDLQSGIVWADEDRLVQVLINLLSNAIKFSPPGGIVRVSTLESQGKFEVQVEDHGRGVPKRYLHSIFERFGQVETSDARDKGGTGLGLAICKSIVGKHAGQIGVESEEGKGSTFFFSIPKPSHEGKTL